MKTLRQYNNRSRAGFTLIEFAVVMIISGFMMVAAVGGYNVFVKNQRYHDTYDRLALFDKSMKAFFESQGRYPCPASPVAAPNSEDAGVEVCINTLLLGTCDATTKICRVGGRDTSYGGVGADPVLIGVIPYKTLRLGLDDTDPDDGILQDDLTAENKASVASIGRDNTRDGWRRMISYAVTESLTTKGGFDMSTGAIGVLTESAATLVNPAGSALWVAFSHGDNGLGAYSSNGKAGPPCTGASKDVANCAAFTAASNVKFISGLRSTDPGINYFDDIVYFDSSRATSQWDRARDDPVTATTPSATGSASGYDIVNRNIGNVGINSPQPAQKLDVGGKVRAVRAQAALICDSNGKNCFNPALLGGSPGLACAAGQVMRGIINGAPVCVGFPPAAAINNDACAVVGQSVVGIDSAGNIICGVP